MTVDGKEERIKAHQFAAGVWACLAADSMEQAKRSSMVSTREDYEKFIQRCITKALRHLREAEWMRKRAIG